MRNKILIISKYGEEAYGQKCVPAFFTRCQNSYLMLGQPLFMKDAMSKVFKFVG